jgi:gluconolactonase
MKLERPLALVALALGLPLLAQQGEAPARAVPTQGPRDFIMERVTTGFQFAEGPAWAADGALVFSDIPSNRILRWSAKEGLKRITDDGGGANGNAFDEQKRLYTCEGRRRRIVRRTAEGKVEILADRFEGKRFNAPNDIVVRHDDHVYFTDPAFGDQVDQRELPFYGIYHLTPRGDLTAVARLETRPNGIALSHNGRALYVADSDQRNVLLFDLDRGGNASNMRVLITGIEGVPDGLKVDDRGDIYVAAGAIAIYSAQGKLLRTLPLPEKPSNLAFGDADGKSLYVTARTSVYRLRLDVKGPPSQP